MLMNHEFIFGEEFLVIKKREEVISNFKNVGFQKRTIIFYQKELHEEISNIDSQASLFAEKEIIDLRLENKSLRKEDLEFLVKLIEKKIEDLIFVVSTTENKIKSSAWFKQISKAMTVHEMSKVYQNQMKDWIKKEALKLEIKISEEEINLICSRNQENLLSAYQELKLFTLREKSTDFSFIKDSSEYQIFSLINCLVSNKTKDAIKILKILKSNNESEQALIFMINQQLERLEELKNDPNYYVRSPRDYWQNLKIKSKSISPIQIKKIRRGLALLDVEFKSDTTKEKDYFWNEFKRLIIRFSLA